MAAGRLHSRDAGDVFDVGLLVACALLVAPQDEHLRAANAGKVTSKADHGAAEDLHIRLLADHVLLAVHQICILGRSRMKEPKFGLGREIQRRDSVGGSLGGVVLRWWLHQLRFVELW